MNYLDAAILGVVEGLTEFLPISSTGHLNIASTLMGLDATPSEEAASFMKTFKVVIQFGAILAVMVLYWRALLINWRVMLRVAIAFVPAAVVGFLFYSGVRKVLDNVQVTLWALVIGGNVIVLFEVFHGERADPPADHPQTADLAAAPPAASEEQVIAHRESLGTHFDQLRLLLQPSATASKASAAEVLPYPVSQQTTAAADIAKMSLVQALLIGVGQTLALIPGVSRSAATVVGGLAVGLKRRAVVEFSFLLAVPTMAAASAYSLYKERPGGVNLQEGILLAIGLVVSFVVALGVVRWLLRFVQTHTFIWFGIYRIVAAGVFWWLLFGR